MPQESALAITRHDYEAMPQGPPYFQVIEGDLIMSPSPESFHQQISVQIVFFIQGFLRKKRLGKVFAAPLDVYLTDINVFQPDVLFISNERRSIITKHGIEGAPDLVVEILSPLTAKYDKGSKRKIYSKTGVQEYWLVDPDAKSIQVYDLTKSADLPIATYNARAKFSSKLLPGLIFKTAEIFAD